MHFTSLTAHCSLLTARSQADLGSGEQEGEEGVIHASQPPSLGDVELPGCVPAELVHGGLTAEGYDQGTPCGEGKPAPQDRLSAP